MAIETCMSAMCMCSFGVAPSTLMVLPISRTLTSNKPAATIQDHIPFMNIMPFGMCTSPANPMVIAQLGAPAACIPLTTSPWIIGSPLVMIGNQPALSNSSMLMCNWAGVINITMPGEFTTMVG